MRIVVRKSSMSINHAGRNIGLFCQYFGYGQAVCEVPTAALNPGNSLTLIFFDNFDIDLNLITNLSFPPPWQLDWGREAGRTCKMQPRHFVFQHAALTLRAFISPEKEKDISGYFHLRLGLGAAQKGPKRVIAALCGHWLASFGQMTNRVELNIFNICSKLQENLFWSTLRPNICM